MIKLFEVISVNTIYFVFDQTWASLTDTDPIVAFFHGPREYMAWIVAAACGWSGWIELSAQTRVYGPPAEVAPQGGWGPALADGGSSFCKESDAR
jgi:hypothetical protein